VPLGSFWTVFTGIAFVLAGSAIVSGIRDVLAAKLLMLMLFLFEVMVEIPPVFVQPHSQAAWGGAVYNLTAIGACWIFVESAVSHRQADQRQTKVSGEVVTAHQDSAIV
jgi:surface polysaccharide O-acyltransferase-like enzyme